MCVCVLVVSVGGVGVYWWCRCVLVVCVGGAFRWYKCVSGVCVRWWCNITSLPAV